MINQKHLREKALCCKALNSLFIQAKPSMLLFEQPAQLSVQQM